MTGEAGEGRWLRSMHAFLYAEIASAEQWATTSRQWFTSVLGEVVPELYADLRTRPVTGRVHPPVRAPLGQPDRVRGVLTVARGTMTDTRDSLYSEQSWQRFLAALDEYPRAAWLEIHPLDGQGYPSHRLEGSCWVNAKRESSGAGWALFSFTIPTADTGWAESRERQEQWAGLLKKYAARVGACAGGISDDLQPGQETSLEQAVADAGGPHRAAAGWREVQRGYWWVTILPPEISARLGGRRGLAASGAFHEVSELPDGSVWLRATATINEFTSDRVRKVFEALAPVLLTGTTEFLYGAKYRIVEGADAAALRSRAT